MSLDITKLRRELREHLGLAGDDTDELPNADTSDKTGTDTYLNRSFWEICTKFDFREKEVIGSFPTVAGTNYYQIPTLFEAINNISIEDLGDFSHKPLTRITRDSFEQKYVNSADQQDKPTLYLRESNGIRLWATPDNAYNITLAYRATLSDLSDSNTTPPMSSEWHEVILFGAIWRAQLGVNRDLAGSTAIRQFQASLIEGMMTTEDKEQEDSHTSGLEVLGRDGEL